MIDIYCSTGILSAFVDISCYFMEMQIMAMDESFFKAHKAFRDSSNFRQVFVNALSKICADVKLGGVRSCLAIGPNEGWSEIEFIKHCEANISKFIGVEPDHASAEHLRTSLRSSLPGVESQVLETTMETWEGPGEPVDLIIMFHVLYHVRPAGKRVEFLKKVHDWLASGGCIALVTASRSEAPNSVYRGFEKVGYPTPPWEEIEAQFVKAGFTKHYEHEMHGRIDLTDPTEDLLPFYLDSNSTLDDLRDVLKGPISEGEVDEFHMFAIFKSTN